jgi:hypothetical protein
MDRYRYIAVIDIDELLMPYLTSSYSNLAGQVEFTAALKQVDDLNRELPKLTDKYLNHVLLEQFKCDRFGKSELKIESNETGSEFSIIEKYIDSLAGSMSVKDTNERTLYLPNAFYINEALAEKLMHGLKQWLVFALKKNGEYHFDKPIGHMEETMGLSEYLLSIKSDQEFMYAKKLLEVYKYVRTRRLIPEMEDSEFMRYVSVSYKSLPRAVHNTNVTLEFGSNLVHSYMDRASKRVVYNEWTLREFDFVKHGPEYYLFEYEEAFLGNFGRRFQAFGRKTLPVAWINVDLNYLNCFVAEVQKNETVYALFKNKNA